MVYHCHNFRSLLDETKCLVLTNGVYVDAAFSLSSAADHLAHVCGWTPYLYRYTNLETARFGVSIVALFFIPCTLIIINFFI